VRFGDRKILGKKRGRRRLDFYVMRECKKGNKNEDQDQDQGNNTDKFYTIKHDFERNW